MSVCPHCEHAVSHHGEDGCESLGCDCRAVPMKPRTNLVKRPRRSQAPKLPRARHGKPAPPPPPEPTEPMPF